jgi:hypothetical protein
LSGDGSDVMKSRHGLSTRARKNRTTDLARAAQP